MRASGDGLIGDGMVEIGPEHPDYQKWLRDAEAGELERLRDKPPERLDITDDGTEDEERDE
jgi:hypothetical protein